MQLIAPVKTWKCRAGSILAGGPVEREFYAALSKAEFARILAAAERFDESARLPGQRNGPLGFAGLAILKALGFRFLNRVTGRLDPSIKTLAALVKRAGATINAGIKALRQHGFLDWLNRKEPTGNEGNKGPQVRQVTNAYRITMPARFRDPLPDDAALRAMAQKAITDEHERFPVGKLAEVLDRLKLAEQAKSDQRDSTRQRGTDSISEISPVEIAETAAAIKKRALEKGRRP
jgi:hypothetical protein